MNKVTRLKYYIESLCIYDFEDDDVFSALYDLLCDDEEDTVALQSYFFKELAKSESLKRHISRLILTNDNIFTKAACAGKVNELSIAVINAVKSDLAKLEEIASLTAQDILADIDDEDIKEILLTLPGWEVGKPLAPLDSHWDRQLDELIKYHRENGYGIYAKNIAFTWRDEEITPVNSIDPIRLTDLKNYELQRNKVIDNTESFIAGHPANNVLLYGDRGTGKSSTVHAILNEYWQKGLRMIEIPKSAVADLSLIREQIADSPMKFIIYIDDLSFDSNDTSFSELKAPLEASLSGKQCSSKYWRENGCAGERSSVARSETSVGVRSSITGASPPLSTHATMAATSTSSVCQRRIAPSVSFLLLRRSTACTRATTSPG